MTLPAASPVPLPAESASPETCLLVLNLLADTADEMGRVTVSVRGVSDRLGIGRSTASRAVASLLDHGLLAIERAGTGAGYPTRYRLGQS